ncbi:uncharacterized protein LOC107491328 [Arachis duranensis]|uniref:Uncharacterized protein LOC107491328 n=1 Tax=Arachis duranensis TaxID=130453 RepID=A0A6P4DKZ6_ARADU|nr:uncharacterized protein LOC107491328 [Arachis duranensis]
MAKVPLLILVFSLSLNFTLLGLVLGQDDPWKSVLDQASKSGLSQDKVNDALSGVSANKGSWDTLGDGDLGDWVQQISDLGTGMGSTSTASPPSDSTTLDIDDDVDDTFKIKPSASNAPQKAPTSAPVSAGRTSPTAAPKLSPTKAPEWAPSQSPGASPPTA